MEGWSSTSRPGKTALFRFARVNGNADHLDGTPQEIRKPGGIARRNCDLSTHSRPCGVEHEFFQVDPFCMEDAHKPQKGRLSRVRCDHYVYELPGVCCIVPA